MLRELSRTQIEYIINEWILNERNRGILKRRFIDGICFEPLAEEYDISVSQVKRIVKHGEMIVSKHS